MARIPKQRVIFDAEKYDLDYLRETRDSYSPMTDAEFEDSISYDMGEDDLRDLMETDWRSNEKALDAFLGKSILVRYSPVNYDDGFVQFNLNDLHDLLHAHTSPLHRVDKVWDEDGHLFLSGKWPDNSPLLVEVRKLTVEGERDMDAILTADRRGDFDAVRGTFHAMWDDPALVSTPRYAELALGMPAEEALAPLPLDHITFDDEIADNGDKLNFYIPVAFNCDAVFGTDVCSLDNDDYLNIYVDYDMRTGKVADHLSVVMEYADRDWEFTTYPLDEAEREALLTKMDAYCRHETGKGISDRRIVKPISRGCARNLRTTATMMGATRSIGTTTIPSRRTNWSRRLITGSQRAIPARKAISHRPCTIQSGRLRRASCTSPSSTTSTTRPMR